MTELVKVVRSRVSNKSFAKKCNKDGCHLSLKDVPKQHLLVDFDKLNTPSGNKTKRCDYLFISDRNSENQPYIAPIELKKGNLDVSKVAAQIKEGVGIAKDLFPKKTAVSFRPIVACGGKATKIEIKKLRQYKINFHGSSEFIRLIRCGSPLIKALRA